MKLTKLLLFLFLLLTASLASAIPALQIEREYKQPDKATFTGTLKGDEYFNWVDLGAGLIAMYNPESKYFEYGVADKKGFLTISGFAVAQVTHQNFLDNTLNAKNQRNESAPYGQSIELEPVLMLTNPRSGKIINIKPISNNTFRKTINNARRAVAPLNR